MLIVLSPAKTLDYTTPPVTETYSQPELLEPAAELIGILRTLSPAQVGSLMSISDKLAALNVARYASWEPAFTPANAKQAVLAFNGDVYEGLDAPSLNGGQLDYLQRHLRILSGLYGVLRPLDLMQAYRLEMGTRLANPHGRDLYAFWGERVTATLNAALAEAKAKVLVNLASEEYFKAVKPAKLAVPVITPVFEDWKNGKYKIIPFFAKRARGAMTRFAAVHGLKRAEELKEFDSEAYRFSEGESSATTWVFRRRLED